MADISDVLNAMVAGAAGAIYPSGTSNPSITGAPVVVYAGWPIPGQLDKDIDPALTVNTSHVTFWARPEVKNVIHNRSSARGDAVAGNVRKETRRQERTIQVSVWCADPAARDVLGKAVDAYFAINQRMPTASGEVFYVRYKSEAQVDEHQKTNIYRRDLILSAEYPSSHDLVATAVTTATATVTQQ